MENNTYMYMTRNLAIYNEAVSALYTEYKYGSKDLTTATGVRQEPQTRTALPSSTDN